MLPLVTEKLQCAVKATMSKLLMGRAVDFYGKPSRMSNKIIIIIPKEFHKDFEKVLVKLMKFHGEEVMD